MSQCPKCGCEVEDPFLGKMPIHDVERCGSFAAPSGSEFIAGRQTRNGLPKGCVNRASLIGAGVTISSAPYPQEFMGNPYPTKSKPVKIGRKHTGAPSLRTVGRRVSAKLKRHRAEIVKWRNFKKEVAAYWRGERDTYPKIPNAERSNRRE